MILWFTKDCDSSRPATGSTARRSTPLRLSAVNQAGASQAIELVMNQPVDLEPDTSVALTNYMGDAFVRDGQVFKKSDDIENVAFGLDVTDRATGASTKVWLLPAQGAIVGGENLKYRFVGLLPPKTSTFRL